MDGELNGFEKYGIKDSYVGEMPRKSIIIEFRTTIRVNNTKIKCINNEYCS